MWSAAYMISTLSVNVLSFVDIQGDSVAVENVVAVENGGEKLQVRFLTSNYQMAICSKAQRIAQL